MYADGKNFHAEKPLKPGASLLLLSNSYEEARGLNDINLIDDEL